MTRLALFIAAAVCLSGAATSSQAQEPQTPEQGSAGSGREGARPARPPKPGVTTPGVRREMSAIKPVAVFNTGGSPDWMVLTDDAVFVTSARQKMVHRLDPRTNTVAASIKVGNGPCGGLAQGFGSVWVPMCGDRNTPQSAKTVVRIDVKTNQIIATIPVGPVQGEGGIAATPEGVWLVTDAKGVLSMIDPKTNKVAAEMPVPEGSAGVTYGEGYVWVTSPTKNMLTGVDPKTAKVVYSMEVGKGPRFVAAGAGSAWTLNQGDGTISQVDAKTGKLIKNIEAGLPGTGGELAFGEGHVWATVIQIPITEVDPATSAVVKQWFGPGGDSVRIGFGSIWLTDLRGGTVSRIDLNQP